MSFCDFNFIAIHFKFLKTVIGKGVFNLFLASMFLVGDDGLWAWVMFGTLAACGLFFILVGCACVEGYDDSDIKKNEIKAQAKSTLSRNKGKDFDDSADNSNLLDTA